MTSRNRQVLWFALRYGLRQWWNKGWNQIYTLAFLYAICLSAWILAFPVIYDLI